MEQHYIFELKNPSEKNNIEKQKELESFLENDTNADKNNQASEVMLDYSDINKRYDNPYQSTTEKRINNNTFCTIS